VARERRNEDISALRAAFDLLAVPSRRRQMRKARLPDDVVLLLRIVADDLTSEAFASHVRKSPNRLREAAAFYIEQVMLAPGADSYRVLGSRRDASTAELRRNLAYLCKWLHSDICRETARSVFLLRVTQAWNNVKTPERRRAYDLGLDVGMEARRIAPENRLHRDSNDPKRNGKTSSASRNASSVGGSRIFVAPRRINLWRRFIAFALGRPR
jgi:hypothetical protein